MIAEFTVRLPWWLLIGVMLIPAMAYIDYAQIGKASFSSYLKICLLEFAFVFIGFIIGVNTK